MNDWDPDPYTATGEPIRTGGSVPADADPGTSAEDPPVTAIGRTWRAASLEPRRFFSTLAARAPLGPAVLYYLVIGIAVAGAQLFWSMVFAAAGIGERFGMIGGDAAWGPVVEFLLSPALLLFSLFAAAGVTHLMLRMLGGASRGFGFTVRVFAYAYSPQILGVIPVVGQMAGFIWMVVIAVIGLSAGHRTSTGRAAAAVLIPLAVVLMFVAFIAMLTAAGALLLEV